MKIIIILTTLMLAGSVVAWAGYDKKETIQWLTPQQLEAQYALEKRPILVDVYTTWCYYCKVMDKTTWKNDSVVAYINRHFYAVKFDAEQKEPVQWMGKTYEYVPEYKAHSLAIALLQGNMSFPATVFVPQNLQSEVILGAFTAKELEMIVKYYGDKKNEVMDPNTYQQQFKGSWR